jgi:N,N'-diacetylchitobiose phosphorylase
MRYGHFDNENREYVFDRVDVPTSWTNYIGVNDMCAVLNQTAGGYSFYKTPQYHRITRFRPNGVPVDRPGHYVYIRDDETGEYWSVSWQPVGKPLDKAKYECRHGLSYSRFSVDYQDVQASQTVFIPLGDPVELWDVKIKNSGGKPRKLSVYSYVEFSFHHIDMDNQNFQMSLYAAGSSYENGVIEHDLFYEEFGWQWFASNFEPDGFDCLRDQFIGPYRTETNPIVVEEGKTRGSFEKGGNHCGCLKKELELKAGEEARLLFMLGEGRRETGLETKKRYADPAVVDKCFAELKAFWNKKCAAFVAKTPDEGMNTSLNIWNLYQAEINVMFSRFASFIEVGGRTGLGYRDTAQDAMTVQHSNPEKCRSRIIELLQGETTRGYGVHLFDPAWFNPEKKEKPFKSPTVVPSGMPHGYLSDDLADVCSDDALWLIPSIVEFIRETGENSLVDEIVTYADGGSGSVYEHMTKILEFSYEQTGSHGICKGLRADWNDCLNLGGGESAMVSYLLYWALTHFIDLAKHLGRTGDAEKYAKYADAVRQVCDRELWDGAWFIRGFTKNGDKIGTSADAEGKVHLESNAWAVLSGAAAGEKALKALDSVDEYLYTPWGVMLNGPSYTVPNEDIGFVTRVYPGIKENGAVFSHPNPWLWAAECMLGRGNRAKKFYDSLLPYNQNDKIEIRLAEPYSYCQFIAGREHTKHGRAHHPFMTGSGGWAYYAATKFMLGVRPDFNELVIDPCVPSDWKEFEVKRVWRGGVYDIRVTNPDGAEKGVKEIRLNGAVVDKIPVQPEGSVNRVEIVMGSVKQ